jgi:Ca2+-binding RTX toxin-like protein
VTTLALGGNDQEVLGTSLSERMRGDFSPNPEQTFEGRAGDDTLLGGTGTDTARYAGEITLADITAVTDADPLTPLDQAGWTVAAGITEGTDNLVGMEIVDDATGGRYLLVGNGAYGSIQAALTDALDGDTIVLAAGTYNENLTITKDVTIVGPNAGKLLVDTRGAEASITGLMTIVADGVTFDGVKFTEGALSAWTGRPTAIVLDADATGLTIASSLFDRTGGGNSSGIETYYGGNNDNLTVTNSSFSGWNIAIYLNPGADNAVITDNAFSNGGGVATDEPNGVQIGANGFTGDAAHIGMTDSTSGFDADFANGGPVAAGNTFTATNYDVDIAPTGTEGQVLNGTALRDYFAGDVAWASAFGQTFHGEGGNDIIRGGAGNDVLYGDAGQDDVDGGAGNDVIIGTLDATNDTYSGGTNDAVDPIAGTGGDTVDYSATSGVTLTLNAGAATVTSIEVGTDTLSGIENIRGGTGVDNLTGDANGNILDGNGDNDVLSGLGGNDLLRGGDGIDDIHGGTGSDRLIGGLGNDTLAGDADADRFVFNTASDGTDLINGFSMPDGDRIEINKNGAGFTGLVSLSSLDASQFVVSNVGGGNSYGGGTGGQATFVLDTTLAPGERTSLWYDNNGDGVVEVKLLEFDASSNLSGFNHNGFLLA